MTTTNVTATPASQAATTTANAASSLGSNLTDFLKLLMTQLQNQDPTQPLDTNQFTSQLVQFANVEQQINANTNLTTLIQLSQGGQLLQAGSLVGKQVEATSDTLALQKAMLYLPYPAIRGMNGRVAYNERRPVDTALCRLADMVSCLRRAWGASCEKASLDVPSQL